MKFVVALVLLLAVTAAQEEKETTTEQEEAVQEEEKVKTQASPYVQVYTVFPFDTTTKFESGRAIDVVVGFHNKAPSTKFNITQVFASLRHPYDWKVAIQNFTRFNPQIIANPSDQISIGYRFFPDPALDTERPFVLAAQVFYQDELLNNYTSYFFNDTIVMVEPSGTIDIQLIFTYTGLFAVAGLAAFFGFRFFAPKKRGQAHSTRDAAADAVDRNEWLKGTAAEKKKK